MLSRVLSEEEFTLLVWEGLLSLVLPVLAEQSHAVAELSLENKICNICSRKTMAKDAT